MVYCTECGAENPDEAKFCAKCGTNLSRVEPSREFSAPEKPLEKPPKMKNGKGKWVVAIIVLVVLGFCGYTFYTEKMAFDALEVDLVGVGVPSVGLTDARIPLTIRFSNATGYDSPPVFIDYDIYIAGTAIGTGSVPETKVPAKSHKDTATSITVRYADVGMGIWDAISRREFTITLRGKVKTKLLFGLIPWSQPFTSSYSLT